MSGHDKEFSLHDSEERYRVLCEASTEGIVIHEDGIIIDANNVFAEAAGEDPVDMIGQPVLNYVDPKDRDFVMQRMRSEYDKPYEVKGIRKDGSTLPVEILGRTITYKGQKIRVVSLRDISDRKKMERESEENKALAQALMNASFDIVISIKTDGTVVALNETAARSLGTTQEYLVGKNGWDLFDSGIGERRKSYAARVAQTGRAVRFRDHRDGRWFDNSMNPVFDETGAVKYVVLFARNITEQKRMEEALRVSEETYRRLVEMLPDAVTASDLNGRINYISNNTISLHGLSDSKEVLGRNALDFIVPEEHERAMANLRKTLEDGSIRNVEYTMLRKDGSRFIGELSAALVRDAKGKPKSFIAAVRDITDRKRTEQALLESEEKFRNLAEQSPNMIFINIKGRLVYVNKKCEELMGYSKEEFYSSDFDFLTLVAPEYTDFISDNFRRHRRGEEVEPVEYAIVSKDGNRIGAISATKLISYGGETAILGIVTDISERKKVELALQESEARYREIASSIPGVVFQLIPKRDGTISIPYISDNIYDLIGMTSEEVKQDPFKAMSLLIPEDFKLIQEQLKKEVSEDDISMFEGQVRAKNGEIRWVRFMAKRYMLPDGEVLGNGVAIDITDQKQAEERIQYYSEHLEEEVQKRTERIHELERQRADSEKLVATGRMAARIAHEINNPLAGIKNSFRLIKDAVPTDNPYYDYVGRIDKEIDRIALIVHRTFELYRPDQESPREISINDTVRDVVALLEPSCRKRHIRAKVNLLSGPRLVSLPGGYITQVLFNIIQNAIEASPESGEITVTVEIKEGKLSIAVLDQGIGIIEEVKPQIFEPFFTTKNDSAAGGLGLGLSVSKGMVEAMGGQLDFESQKDQGTTFYIVIPLNEGKGVNHG